jgi:hypothetical protein
MYCKKIMLPLVVGIYTFGISTTAIFTNFTDDYFKNNASIGESIFYSFWHCER